jgi:uncharacterized peroxidase-related enzyme
MPAFPLIDEATAQGDVARIFADFRRTKGTAFVPNFFKTLANAPAAMEGTWNVYRDVGNRGLLPTALKEMLFVAISAARNCQYCTTAHLAFCTLLGVDPATLAVLATNIGAIEPQRTREVIQFAVRCATDPGSLAEANYDVLRGQGITEAEIIEIVAMAAFSVYATIVADALKVDIDPGFHAIVQGGRDAGPQLS